MVKHKLQFLQPKYVAELMTDAMRCPIVTNGIKRRVWIIFPSTFINLPFGPWNLDFRADFSPLI